MVCSTRQKQSPKAAEIISLFLAELFLRQNKMSSHSHRDITTATLENPLICLRFRSCPSPFSSPDELWKPNEGLYMEVPINLYQETFFIYLNFIGKFHSFIKEKSREGHETQKLPNVIFS